MNPKTLFRIGIAALLCSSCAVVEPYKVGKRADVYEPIRCEYNDANFSYEKKDPNDPSRQIPCTPMGEVDQRALNLQSRYLTAAGQDELVQKIVGSSTTLLTSYALLLGASPGIAAQNAPDQILALGAGVASSTAVGRIFTSTQRQRVFLSGATGIVCIRQAAMPFVTDTDTLTLLSKTITETGNGSFRENIAIVEQVIEETNRLNIAALSARPAITQADYDATAAYVRGIRAELAAARKALSLARRQRTQITSTSPARYSLQLATLDGQLGSQLQTTTFGLADILRINADLRSAAANVAPQFAVPPSTPSNKTATTMRASSYSSLGFVAGRRAGSTVFDSALSELRTRTSEIIAISLDLEERIKGVTDFAQCNFEPVDLALRLEESQISMKQTGTATFKVLNGEGPYDAVLVGSPASVSAPEFRPRFGDVGYVTTSGTTVDEFQINVTDQTGTTVTLTVKTEP